MAAREDRGFRARIQKEYRRHSVDQTISAIGGFIYVLALEGSLKMPLHHTKQDLALNCSVIREDVVNLCLCKWPGHM